MSQPNQYPPPQGQPGWGQQPPPPPGWGTPQPQPPRKNNTGKIVGFSCLGVVGLVMLLGIIGVALSGGTDDTSSSASDKATTAAEKPAAEDKPKEEKEEPAAEEPQKSQAEQFQDFVAKNGLPAEKEAVKHVTKVQGAGEQNDIADVAEVYTDFSGGLTGPHQSEGKLIASAFADWKKSENGLVTVYDKDGEILANGNF